MPISKAFGKFDFIFIASVVMSIQKAMVERLKS